MRHVDVVIRVDRLLAAFLTAGDGDGAVRNDLVRIHVALRARSGLPDAKRKVGVELAGDHLIGGLRNEFAFFFRQLAQVSIRHGGGFFENTQGFDHFGWEDVLADVKMDEGARGLGAPVGVMRNGNLSHGVAFETVRGGIVWLSDHFISWEVLDMANEIVFIEANFWCGGVFVGCGAIADTAGDDSVEAFCRKVEDGIVFSWVEALHRTGIHAKQGRGRHEISECNINLSCRPFACPLGTRAVDNVGHHHVAVEGQRIKCYTTDFGDAGEKLLHIGRVDFFRYRKNNVVRAVGDL